MIIAIDFDGTLCENEYPKIGKPYHQVINKVKELRNKGNKLILWTCRDGKCLTKALQWCKLYELIFDEINENLPEIKELYGGTGRKIFADVYLDDKNITTEGFIQEIYNFQQQKRII